MERTEIVVNGAGILSAALAAVTPSEDARLYAFCFVGGVAGGYLATIMPHDVELNVMSLRRRWAANICAAIVGGPFFAEYLFTKFPENSKPAISLLAGGGCGVAGVSLLCILLPKLRALLKKKSHLP